MAEVDLQFLSVTKSPNMDDNSNDFWKATLSPNGGFVGNDEFGMLDELEKISGVKVPQGLACLRTAKVLHTQQCVKEDMPKVVLSLVK